jgi:hypothetical protein
MPLSNAMRPFLWPPSRCHSAPEVDMPCRLILLLLIHTAFLFRTLFYTRVFSICISDAKHANIFLDYALLILKSRFSIILFFFVCVSLPQPTMMTMGEFLRAIKIVKGNETRTKEKLYFLKKFK